MLVCPSVLTKQKETGQRFVSVCVWHLIRRWQMVLVTASVVAKPFTQEALLAGFVLMSRSTKRRSHYHSLIVLTRLGQISPVFFLYPDCPSHTWSTINTPLALFTNTLLCFHWDKHAYFAAALPPRHTHTQIFPVTHHSSVVASCP